MATKAQDIMALVEMFESSGWDELRVEIDGLYLFLSKDPDARLVSSASPAPAPAPAAPSGPVQSAPAAAPATAAEVPAAASRPATGAGEAIPANWVAVTAPHLGTFYRAPKPGAAPYVEVGQSVEEDTEICLIEVMKLFSPLRAGVKGIVRRICAADAELVEHGQILFYIEPA